MGELTLSQLSSQFDLLFSFRIFLLMPLRTKKSPHGYSKVLKGLFWWSFSPENKNRVGGGILESAAVEIFVKMLVFTWALGL